MYVSRSVVLIKCVRKFGAADRRAVDVEENFCRAEGRGERESERVSE